MGNSAFFHGKQQIPWQTASSVAQRENRTPQNTAGHGDDGV